MIVRHVLKLLAALFVLFSLWQASSGEAETEIKTNEIFLRESIQGLLNQTFADFPKDLKGLILIRPDSDNSAAWLVEQELTSYLITKGFGVALSQPELESENSENCCDLFYRIIELRLEYPQMKRKGLFGKKFVIRQSTLNSSFRLTEKDSGKILWTKRKNHTTIDEIPKKMVPILENEEYPFFSPELPQSTGGKYLEPALVTAVVGGLVYLFFASR
jgi:hypothetical protein